jgi:predicted SnoaL-like aldol condensation-catalyzing enzyme
VKKSVFILFGIVSALECTAVVAQIPGSAAATTTSMQVTAEEKRVLERTRELTPLVQDFVRMMYVDRKGHDAFLKYVAEDLIEHDPEFPDGRESSFTFFGKRFEGPNKEHYLPIEQWKVLVDQVVVHGDLAIVRTHAFQRVNDKGRVFINFWRWEGKRIVEHWDVIMSVPNDKANPRSVW